MEIKPDGSPGHIAVSGKCAHHVHTMRNSNWHSIEFGFEFEPQQLDKAVKSDDHAAKTGLPVQYEITANTRDAIAAWISSCGLSASDHLFPSRIAISPYVTIH